MVLLNMVGDLEVDRHGEEEILRNLLVETLGRHLNVKL